MVNSILNRKMLREMSQLRPQIISIALLIICGISLMIATQISYHSLKRSRDHFYQTFSFAELFADFQAAPQSLIPALQQIPGVQILEPSLLSPGLIEVNPDSDPATGQLLSVPSGSQAKLNQIFVRQGRLPLDAEDTEVLIHEGFAEAHHLSLGDHISALVKGHKVELRVVGIGISPEYVYALSAGIPLPDDLHFGVFWLTEKTLARIMQLQNTFNHLALVTDGTRSLELVKHDLDRILAPYGNRGAYGRERISSHMFVEDEITEQRTMSIVSPLIFLSIALFLVHMILSRLILTHRPVIAVMKAVGYNDQEIAWHYAKFILAIMMIGTIPACGLGIWLGQLIVEMYHNFFRFPQLELTLSSWTLVWGFFLGLAPGILGGFTAIRSILELPPAEALKPPVPPSFQASFLDRLNIKRKLNITTLMTLRNLLLRPLRFGLTVLGISAALALVITSGSFNDMIGFLLSAQFSHVQREDINIGLLRPIAVNGLQEIAGIPGVLKVEGFRIVPVRLRSGNFQKETALMGWPQNSLLRQRVDVQLRNLPLPEQGIFLSRYFATKWNIQQGDWIDIEVMEGNYLKTRVRVTGFSQDLLGVQGTMRIEDLWGILNEPTGFNYLCLQVDPSRIKAVYSRLKQYPLIQSVTMKASIYQGFEKSMGGLLRFSTALLIFFAFVIAMGLIHNTVIMNFSERSREVASLRVLGFSHFSLFRMLLQGIIVQISLSLLPGCILGYKITQMLTGLMRTDTLNLPPIIHHSTYAVGIATIFLALFLSAWNLWRLIGKLNLTDALKAKD